MLLRYYFVDLEVDAANSWVKQIAINRRNTTFASNQFQTIQGILHPNRRSIINKFHTSSHFGHSWRAARNNHEKYGDNSIRHHWQNPPMAISLAQVHAGRPNRMHSLRGFSPEAIATPQHAKNICLNVWTLLNAIGHRGSRVIAPRSVPRSAPSTFLGSNSIV